MGPVAEIVIIDDDAGVRRLFRDILEGAGHGVRDAASAKEGLRLVRAKTTDVVITDILMPDMDGLEVTRTLHREAPRIKVIAISGGRQDVDYCTVARFLGAHETLMKPVTVERLVATVADVLKRPSL
jgi:two-component system KDP operon response regulator KdpE